MKSRDRWRYYYGKGREDNVGIKPGDRRTYKKLQKSEESYAGRTFGKDLQK